MVPVCSVFLLYYLILAEYLPDFPALFLPVLPAVFQNFPKPAFCKDLCVGDCGVFPFLQGDFSEAFLFFLCYVVGNTYLCIQKV